MLRKLAATATATLAFMGLAGCEEHVAKPAWTDNFKPSVWKHSCSVTHLPTQQKFNISSWGHTQLPDGFTASRGRRICEIQGPDNVTCNYGTSDKVSYCYKTKKDAPTTGSW